MLQMDTEVHGHWGPQGPDSWGREGASLGTPIPRHWEGSREDGDLPCASGGREGWSSGRLFFFFFFSLIKIRYLPGKK